MPFLRSELNLTDTLGGLHLSAFALGMIGAERRGAGCTLGAAAAILGWRCWDG